MLEQDEARFNSKKVVDIVIQFVAKIEFENLEPLSGDAGG